MNNENKQKAKEASLNLIRKITRMLENDFEYDDHYKESMKDHLYFAKLYFSDLEDSLKLLPDFDKQEQYIGEKV